MTMYKIILGSILLIMGVVGISIYKYSNKSETEINYRVSSEADTLMNDVTKQEDEPNDSGGIVSGEKLVAQPESDGFQVKEMNSAHSPKAVPQESSAILETDPASTLENKNVTTVEPKSFSIETNQSVIFGDLTITHLGGGHDMLVDGEGHDAGDSSFASFALETPRTPRLEVGFDDTSHEIEQFDSYLITIDSIGWEGTVVTFTVKNVAN